MAKQIWICEKCFSQWTSEDAAKHCEAIHKEPIEVKPLSWVSYDRDHWSAGYERQFPQRLLLKIKVEPHEGWDYATYVLERVGPKGV